MSIRDTGFIIIYLDIACLLKRQIVDLRQETGDEFLSAPQLLTIEN